MRGRGPGVRSGRGRARGAGAPGTDTGGARPGPGGEPAGPGRPAPRRPAADPASGQGPPLRDARPALGERLRQMRDTYLDSLVERSLLSRENRRFLGLFPYHRHFPVQPDLVPSLRRRFALAETAGYPDHRDRLLAALVSAIGR
ncbi:GPP34 family phosphoprotein [Streptomyces sp. NPDC089173]|uniref:GPP34 family phosphoprotein n=1 Tax=Streptomyces sp. NPDC089173 TaxID=3154965 RepID=UPI00344B7E66